MEEREERPTKTEAGILSLISALEKKPVEELYRAVISSGEFTARSNAAEAIKPNLKKFTIRPAKKKQT